MANTEIVSRVLQQNGINPSYATEVEQQLIQGGVDTADESKVDAAVKYMKQRQQAAQPQSQQPLPQKKIPPPRPTEFWKSIPVKPQSAQLVSAPVQSAMSVFNFSVTLKNKKERDDLKKALCTEFNEGLLILDKLVKSVEIGDDGSAVVELDFKGKSAELTLSAAAQNSSVLNARFASEEFNLQQVDDVMVALKIIAQKYYAAFLKAALVANPDVDLDKNPLTITLDLDNSELPTNLDWKEAAEIFHKVGFVGVTLRRRGENKYSESKQNDPDFMATVPTTSKESRLQYEQKSQQEILSGCKEEDKFVDDPASAVDLEEDDEAQFQKQQVQRHAQKTAKRFLDSLGKPHQLSEPMKALALELRRSENAHPKKQITLTPTVVSKMAAACDELEGATARGVSSALGVINQVGQVLPQIPFVGRVPYVGSDVGFYKEATFAAAETLLAQFIKRSSFLFTPLSYGLSGVLVPVAVNGVGLVLGSVGGSRLRLKIPVSLSSVANLAVMQMPWFVSGPYTAAMVGWGVLSVNFPKEKAIAGMTLQAFVNRCKIPVVARGLSLARSGIYAAASSVKQNIMCLPGVKAARRKVVRHCWRLQDAGHLKTGLWIMGAALASSGAGLAYYYLAPASTELAELLPVGTAEQLSPVCDITEAPLPPTVFYSPFAYVADSLINQTPHELSPQTWVQKTLFSLPSAPSFGLGTKVAAVVSAGGALVSAIVYGKKEQQRQYVKTNTPASLISESMPVKVANATYRVATSAKSLCELLGFALVLAAFYTDSSGESDSMTFIKMCMLSVGAATLLNSYNTRAVSTKPRCKLSL